MEGPSKSTDERIMSEEASSNNNTNSNVSPSKNSSEASKSSAAASSNDNPKGEVRPVSSSPEEEHDNNNNNPSIITTTIAAASNNDGKNDHPGDDGKNEGSASNNIHIALKNNITTASSPPPHAAAHGVENTANISSGSGSTTSALQLLKSKKRKRKSGSGSVGGNKSIKKKEVLSSFQDNDDEEEGEGGKVNKRTMDEFLLTNTAAADDKDDFEGGEVGGEDHAQNINNDVDDDDDGVGVDSTAEKKLAAAAATDDTNDDDDDNVVVDSSEESNHEKDDTPISSSSSSILHTTHHHPPPSSHHMATHVGGGGVIPPDRVMSPMPQNERENVPLCHSPNVPDVGTTVSGMMMSSTTTTTTTSGNINNNNNNNNNNNMVGTNNANACQLIMEHHSINNSNNVMGGGGRLNTTLTANSMIRMQQQNNVGQMRVLQQQQQQQQASQQLAQRFSSSSGEIGANKATNNNNSITVNATSQQQQQAQPPGWRVKLYRLNMDGTWDDCGTGRIQFYYARGGGEGHTKGGSSGGGGEGDGNLHHQHQQQQQHQQYGTKTTMKNLFRELGEPMLCMRAELSQKQQQQQQQQQQAANNSSNAENKSAAAATGNSEGGGPSSSPSSPGEKVLLRTRVLLHEAYQCQGGNIITWCEPFHAHGKQKEKVDAAAASASANSPSARTQQQQQQSGDSAVAAAAASAGVDLALSFQDNAGCKDIWQHILNVQSCAREATTHFANNNSATSSSSSLIHSPLSPIKVTTSSFPHAHPLHNSPNSPDHDFVEDKLIATGGVVGSPLGGGIPIRPPIWTKDSSNNAIIGNNTPSSSSSSLLNAENRLLHSHNHALSSNKSSYSSSSPSSSDDDEEEKQFHDAVDHMTAVSMAAAAAASYKPLAKDGNNVGNFDTNVSSPLSMGGGGTPHGFHMTNNHFDPNAAAAGGGGGLSPLQLPKNPTWDDLQNIGDVIASVHIQQREDFLIFLSQSDCAYIKLLLGLFPPAEERGEDITELAVIIKTILLLNDPEIIEYVTSDAPTFELICAVQEYDPELREKANHRDFIRKCAKFRTVVKMEDEELVSQIHHLFRVTYLRDNVLRPTMDESSLSTLVSLAQFTQSDIIKGVITAPKIKVAGGSAELPGVSYLTKVIRLLSVEIDAIRKAISDEEESNAAALCQNQSDGNVGLEEESEGTMWQQHLAPQDSSLNSRHIRRKGCLMFLKELFCKARVSLQQPEKDEFVESSVSNSKLLYLLGAILSDPNVGVDERGAALEIVSVVAMHDPCVIRRHCLQGAGTAADDSSNEMFSCLRPDPNDHREVIFICPPNDLLLSILFVMATETDAGLLLQTSEIIRIILDTDILGEQGTLNGSFMNEENDINAINSQNIRHDAGSEAQNSFLALFYDRYIQWLVSPFQYKMFISKSILPLLSESNRDESFSAINRMRQEFKHYSASEEKSLTPVAGCAVRASFTLEILSFCVRAHVYRMKFFILRTRLLGTILKMLCQKASHPHQMASGGKCLKLATLKFLRSILSVKDEFYHRHIVQYNLFAPVFDAFRITPVGSNLISSAILEMCDFIRTENIKSLLEYIVTKHLTKSTSPGEKSLEDIANPHVDTFAQLRRRHEENMGVHLDLNDEGTPGNNDGATFSGRPAPVMNKKALEDQRRYREAESEESYFNDDDDEEDMGPTLPQHDEKAASLPTMSDTASLLADVASLE